MTVEHNAMRVGSRILVLVGSMRPWGKTRFVMLIALPDGHAADVVADALAAKIVELPAQLRRSPTWDQG